MTVEVHRILLLPSHLPSHFNGCVADCVTYKYSFFKTQSQELFDQVGCRSVNAPCVHMAQKFFLIQASRWVTLQHEPWLQW